MTMGQRVTLLQFLQELKISLPGVPDQYATSPCATCEFSAFVSDADSPELSRFHCLKINGLKNVASRCSRWLPAAELVSIYGSVPSRIEKPLREEERLAEKNNCHACKFCIRSPAHHSRYSVRKCVLLDNYQSMPDVIRAAGEWPAEGNITRCTHFEKVPDILGL